MVEISQEQAAAMKEKLANMSPEELREFQKKQCIFCQIIAGKVASKKVYSDEHCTALLDINPANPGHILLLPNEHYSIMPLMPEAELGHMFMVAKALCQASLKALEAQGTNIFVANGMAAGQKAQHFMLHIIPRKENDSVKMDIPQMNIKDSGLQQVIARLRPAIEKALGPGIRENKKEEPEKIDGQKEIKHEPESNENEPKESESKNVKIAAREAKKPRGSGKFVTSEKARRFHSPECPFAEKIPESDKIFINEDDANVMAKLACGCTGLKKKPHVKKDAPKKEKKAGKKQNKEEAPEEYESQSQDEYNGNDKKNHEAGVTLDDISSLLAGGR